MKLNKASVAAIERTVGMSHRDMVKSSACVIDGNIERKYGSKLSFNIKKGDVRIMSRGSVFVALRRYLMPVSR